LLRECLESFGWVVNEIFEDYGLDFDVQVFEGKSPTGAWFHVQLKSSEPPNYSADDTFISQTLSIDHARHYMNEMKGPVLLVVADTTANRLFWCAPQLLAEQAEFVEITGQQTVTVRVPTSQELPATAPLLLESLDKLYLMLSTRQLTSASLGHFADTLKHLDGQDQLLRDFQEKADVLKLHRVRDLFNEGRYSEARLRANAVVNDFDSSVEIKYEAQVQSESSEYAEIAISGKPQSELSKSLLRNAKKLQALVADGPRELKFAALIKRKAAELEILSKESSDVHMSLKQHVAHAYNLLMILDLYARRTSLLRKVSLKYNQCVRLARMAAGYDGRWALGRPLSDIVKATAIFLASLRSEGRQELEQRYIASVLQISKLAAWTCSEAGDYHGVAVAVLAAVVTVHDADNSTYKWAKETAEQIPDAEVRASALEGLDRQSRRWKGEVVAGDHQGDTIWQIIQNVASAHGIDISDEASPLVKKLRIAARDDDFGRVLKTCEHIVVTIGAIGPTARFIQSVFATTMAARKVVHCALHNFHLEASDLDSAYASFKKQHCDTCPDKKPRPKTWTYSEEEKVEYERQNRPFLRSLTGTPFCPRPTESD